MNVFRRLWEESNLAVHLLVRSSLNRRNTSRFCFLFSHCWENTQKKESEIRIQNMRSALVLARRPQKNTAPGIKGSGS
jgi:hypothetical protein